MSMKKDKLVLHMLGGYTLTLSGKPITLGRGKMTKSVQLLQLLLLHIEKGIAKEELVHALYNWEGISDTNNSLNSMIYRLKNQLIAAGLPKEEYITIRNGICKWSGSIPVEVDVVEFEHYAKAASNLDNQERIDVLEKTLELYKGEFLPQLANELWVTVESVRLKKIHVSCVKHIGDLLEEAQDYQRLLQLYTNAAHLYPFDDW